MATRETVRIDHMVHETFDFLLSQPTQSDLITYDLAPMAAQLSNLPESAALEREKLACIYETLASLQMFAQSTGDQGDQILGDLWLFLTSQPTPQAILEHHGSQAFQARVSLLLDLSRQGRLSDDLQAEMDLVEQLGHFMTRLKARAARSLSADE